MCADYISRASFEAAGPDEAEGIAVQGTETSFV